MSESERQGIDLVERLVGLVAPELCVFRAANEVSPPLWVGDGSDILEHGLLLP